MQVQEANEMKLDSARELFLREKTPVMLCGFSGGADSTAALCVSDLLKNECGFSLVAVHFDHGLRKESASEAEWCQEFCAARNIRCIVEKLNVSSDGGGLENAARQARLAAWKRLSALHGNAAVITGHHANDKCENLFLRLFRGSNASGLTGMRSVSVVEQIKFIRPLLNVTKSEIEEYLRRNGIESWMVDQSNFDSAMLRNYLRNEVIPGIVKRAPFAGAGLMKSLDVLACDADFIEQEAEKIYSSGNVNARTFWMALHDAVAVRVLRKYLAKESGNDVPVSADSFARFKSEVSKNKSEMRIIPVGGGVEIAVQGERVDILHPAPQQLIWNWKTQESVQFGEFIIERRYTSSADKAGADRASFDAALLDDTVMLSAAVEGEKFVPFGRKSPENIKKLRVDRKIPSYPVLPVFRDLTGNALWLPFVRNGNRCLVSSDTKEIVTFYAKRVSKSDSR